MKIVILITGLLGSQPVQYTVPAPPYVTDRATCERTASLMVTDYPQLANVKAQCVGQR